MTDSERKGRGGARAGAGRRTLYPGGRRQLAISCGAEQKEAIQRAAEASGMTVAQYVLMRCGVMDKSECQRMAL